jgi:hypothetical protein
MPLSKGSSIGEASYCGFGLQMACSEIHAAFLEERPLRNASSVDSLPIFAFLGQCLD